MKFGRAYKLKVLGRSGSFVTVSFPVTLELSITHDIWASANHAELALYNLSATHRNEIFYNQYDATLAPVQLRAGYVSQQPKGDLPLVFDGYAKVAYTERNGADLVTRIEAIDNGDATGSNPPAFLDGSVEHGYTAPVNTPFVTIVRELMGKLNVNGVKTGSVVIERSQLPENVKTKPRPFIGNVWEILQGLANEVGAGVGANVFIENNTCHMLSQNSVLPGDNNLGTLSAFTGLLGIPKYTGDTVLCACVFEPAVEIGKKIELKSTDNREVNGVKKIIGYTHRGRISGVESGSLITDLILSSTATALNG